MNGQAVKEFFEIAPSVTPKCGDVSHCGLLLCGCRRSRLWQSAVSLAAALGMRPLVDNGSQEDDWNGQSLVYRPDEEAAFALDQIGLFLVVPPERRCIANFGHERTEGADISAREWHETAAANVVAYELAVRSSAEKPEECFYYTKARTAISGADYAVHVGALVREIEDGDHCLHPVLPPGVESLWRRNQAELPFCRDCWAYMRDADPAPRERQPHIDYCRLCGRPRGLLDPEDIQWLKQQEGLQ